MDTKTRVVGIYIALGEALEAMTTLIVHRHPGGTVTVSPADTPELICPLIPETARNLEIMHALAEVERRRKAS